MVLLRGEDAERTRATLIAINDRIRSAIASGSDAVLFVYYSGHADADALHMAGSRFPLTEVEQLVRGSAATFRVLVVDACRSGALTRVKGGRSAPPFEIQVDERLSEQGLVLLTSSSANEDAQESDALRGSFFTHHLVSALLGAGDSDGDGRVTLEEAYRYAYEATLRSTSETWSGIQHPTFRYELQGAGKLALSELPIATPTRATLVFPPGRTYLLIEGNERGGVVAGVADVARVRRLRRPGGALFACAVARPTTRSSKGRSTPPPAPRWMSQTTDCIASPTRASCARARGSRPSPTAPRRAICFGRRSATRAASVRAFAGYTVHLERGVSVGARVAGCHAGFSTDVLQASSDEIGGELRVAHTWDAPVVGFDLGLALGGWLFAQTFTTAGMAPARYSPAVSLAFAPGLHVDIGGGLALTAEAAMVVYVYPQADGGTGEGTVSLTPRVAFRSAFGLAKVW